MRQTFSQLIANQVCLLTLLMLSSVSQADVIGKLSGDLSVSQGQVSYSLSLPTPNGVHDVNPNLSLHYGAQATNNIVGPSFILKASSAITRCTPTIEKDGFQSAIQVDQLSRFCHDGQRLISVSGSDGQNGTEYRSYDNNNVKYQSLGGSNYTPEKWVLNTPSGYELEFHRYGADNDQHATWLLKTKADHFDNVMEYSYEDNSSPTISNISYSGYEVEFKYQDKLVPASYYQTGELVNNDQLLDRIILRAPNTDLLYFYDFTYEYFGESIAVERLKSVTQCFAGTVSENNDACLKPVVFGYQDLPNPASVIDRLEQDLTIVIPDDYYNPSSGVLDIPIEERPSYVAADVTGNGFADFCYYKVGAGIVCAESNGGSFELPSSWSSDLGYTASTDDFEAYGLVNLLDLNLDGKADFCITDDNGIRCGLSNGETFTSVSYWSNSINKSFSGVTYSYVDDDEYIDVCGTGDDSTYRCYGGNGSNFNSQLLSFNDVDFFKSFDWQYEYSCVAPSGICTTDSDEYEIGYPAPSFVDIDGDFDKDLCWISEDRGAFVCKIASTSVSTKQLTYSAPESLIDLSAYVQVSPQVNSLTASATENSNWKTQADNASASSKKLSSGFRFANLNGDGLVDVCYVAGSSFQCHVNRGDGFNTSSQWLSLTQMYSGLETIERNYKASTFRLVDRNLDGLSDLCLIHSEYEQCAYNNGESFDTLENRLKIFPDIEGSSEQQLLWTSFMHKLFGGHRTQFSFESLRAGFGNLVEVGDLNNDGYSEFCYRSIWGIACSTNDNYGPTSLLASVTDSYGLTTDVVYDALASGDLYESIGSVPEGFREQLTNTWVVASIISDTATVDSSSTNTYRNQIDYRYGGFLVSDDGELSGFSQISEIQADRNFVNITYFYTYEENDGDKLFGRQHRTITTINGITVKEITNQMSVDELDDGTRRLVLNGVETKQYELDGSLYETTSTENSNFDEYGFAQTITTTKTLGSETLEIETKTAYLNDIVNWLLGRADYQTVTHTQNGIEEERVVDYEYADGKLVKQVLQPGADNKATIEFKNFDNGYPELVETSGVSDYDGNTQIRSIAKTYDALGRVLTETNALDQSISYTYHPRCGGISTVSDIADRITVITYNEYCEKVSENFPDSNQTSWQYDWATGAEQSALSRSAGWPRNYHNPIVYKVTETKATDSKYGDFSNVVYYDAQGRAVRSLSTGFTSDSSIRRVKTETAYDQYGYRTAITDPFYSINGLEATPRWTTFGFDTVGRISTEHKVGPDKNDLTVNYTYDGASSSISYSDYAKTTVVNVHGEPVSVTENGLAVEYEYTPAGSLDTTTTGGALEVDVDYDSRGFKTDQIDPSMGAWEYQHNAFGELVYQKDAKGQIVKLYYDVLGRMISKISPEGASSWQYLSTGNGIGQLDTENGIDAAKSWTYDSLGRVQTETLFVNVEEFTTTYVHDEYSRLIETIYPSIEGSDEGVSLFKRYDNIGKLQNISMKARDFKDIDFEFLAAEKETLLIELERLESLQQAALNKAQYHSDQALKYHDKYQYFLVNFNEVNDAISSINELAREHQDRANDYIALYRELLEKANTIKAQFGDDHRYTQISEDDEFHYYARTYCVSQHGWGPTKYCAKYKTDQVQVAKSDLLITRADGSEQFVSAPSTINPVTFFRSLAERYQAQSLAQQQVVGNIIGSEENTGITGQTVTELDQQTLDMLVEFIQREVQIQELEFHEMEFKNDNYKCYVPNYPFGGIVVISCGTEIRDAINILRDEQTVLEGTSTAYQAGAGASNYSVESLSILYDFIRRQSFLGSVELIKEFEVTEGHRLLGSWHYSQDDLNLDDLIEGRRPIVNSVYAQIQSRESISPSFFSNSQVVDIVKEMVKAQVKIRIYEDLEVYQAYSSYYEIEIPAAQTSFNESKALLSSLSFEDPINEIHTKPVERIEQEERLIPIMVGDIVTFIPATVDVSYIDIVEITIEEAKVYYSEQRDYYFDLMTQAIAESSAAIDDLDGGIDNDLAVIESRLGAIEEGLQVIDLDSLDSLAQSQNDLNTSNGRLTLWHAAKRTAKGHLQTEIYGNGLYTHRELAAETGLVEEINTAVVNGESLRHLSYLYDARGRITDKTDDYNGLGNFTSESFLYNDPQGRISDWTFEQTIIGATETQFYDVSHYYEHDDLGNLLEKTDAGRMVYDPATNHLSSRSINGDTYAYDYDANGNMDNGDGRSYVWNSFNKAKSVTVNGQTVRFEYDASHKRVMKTAPGETRYYVSPGYERVERGGEVIHRYTVWSGIDTVAVLEKSETVQADAVNEAKTADKISYIHRDILGSGELVTDSRMQIVARRYYSPYGRLIDDLVADQKAAFTEQIEETAIVADGEDLGTAVWGKFDQTGEGEELLSRYIAGDRLEDLSGVRGFTSHESIEEVGLVNMNARLYDPVIGRFASADSMIPSIDTPLDYNRYAYVRGNPVVSRDPSGHFPWAIAAAVAFYATSHYGDNASLQEFSSLVLAATMMSPDIGVMAGAEMSFNVAFTRAATHSLTASFLQSGKIGRKSLGNAALSGLAAGATYGLAHGGAENGPLSLLAGEFSWVKLTAAHMTTQGVVAKLRGDKFIHGAISALASKLGSRVTGGVTDPFARSIIVGTFGGLAAEATGGDFSDGAIAAAVVHLFNDAAMQLSISNPDLFLDRLFESAFGGIGDQATDALQEVVPEKETLVTSLKITGTAADIALLTYPSPPVILYAGTVGLVSDLGVTILERDLMNMLPFVYGTAAKNAAKHVGAGSQLSERTGSGTELLIDNGIMQ